MERYLFSQVRVIQQVNGEIFAIYIFGEGDNDPLTQLQTVDASRRHEFRRHDFSLQQSHALELKLCITLIDKNI